MTPEQLAERLLTPLWRGIPPEYKSRYARNIWQQYEDNIRSAAYTSRLGVFVDTLCRKLGVAIRAEDTDTVQAMVGSGEDRACLKLLRDETMYLVLLVRVANDERRAARAETEQGAMF